MSLWSVFQIRKRDGLARLGELELPHGRVRTPTLMPVINPNMPFIDPKEMESIGAEMFITNSYIIMSTRELRERARDEGIHAVIGTERPIMTDSGAFQGHMYGKVRTDNLEVLDFQSDIGVDIATILDIFSEPHFTYEEAKHSVEETYRRGREAVEKHPDMNLAGPVQGGLYEDLREKSARLMSSLNFAIHPIGGVVPLMESYRYADLIRVIISSKKGLNPSRPVHLFGAGHPMVFPFAALLGCDLFDSSSYAKYAYDGRMMFPWGTERLENMHEFPCSCPVCSRYTPEEVRSMPKEERERMLALHNLYVSFSEIRRVREAIRKGTLWEMVEQRARARPELMDALRTILGYPEYLEKFEPRTRKSTFLYVGRESALRPSIIRASRDAERIARERKRRIVPESEHPYSRAYEELMERKELFAVKSPIGIVPVELDSTYPFGQSIYPQSEIEDFEPYGEGEIVDNWDIEIVRAIARFQFGDDGAKLLLDGKIRTIKSRNTGKIRNVMVDGEHVLSLRAEDGMFTLKLAGGLRLHRAPFPRYRVVVSEGDDFIREGKNVFAKFVADMDSELRPMDECIVVNKGDEFLGVGQVILVRDEALSFERGVAVRVREGKRA